MRAAPVILVILLLPSVLAAESVVLKSPPDDFLAQDRAVIFIFDIDSERRIESCRLFLDGAVAKAYGAISSNKNVRLQADVEPGEYEWSIECTAEGDRKLASPTRQLRVALPDAFGSNVEIEYSGLVEGARRYIFHIDTLQEHPVVLEGVRPNDVVEIRLDASRRGAALEKSSSYLELYLVRGSSDSTGEFADLKSSYDRGTQRFKKGEPKAVATGEGKPDVFVTFLGKVKNTYPLQFSLTEDAENPPPVPSGPPDQHVTDGNVSEEPTVSPPAQPPASPPTVTPPAPTPPAQPPAQPVEEVKRVSPKAMFISLVTVVVLVVIGITLFVNSKLNETGK